MSAGEERPEPTDTSGLDGLQDASNVLVLLPAMDDAARQSYFETLFPEQTAEFDVFAVDYRRTPAQWAEAWKRYVGGPPQSCVVVSVDETRGTSTTSAAVDSPEGPTVSPGVESPADLTGLGITVSEYLSEHAGPQTFVTFDSLTVLLQYVDLQRVFRFLHVLANRVTTSGGLAHFYMDPEAHSQREIATLASLFDAVAEYDGGGWSVRSR
jgi:hypothetical protein